MSSHDQRKQRESGRGGTENLPQSSVVEARTFKDEDSRVGYELDASAGRTERKEKRRKSSSSKKSRSDRMVERDPALSQSQEEIQQGQNASDIAPVLRPEISAGEARPGLAAEYYGDAGESVAQQPGNRTHSPSLIVGAEPHLQAASSEAAPPIEPSQMGGTGAAASFYSETFDDGITPNADQQAASHYSTAPSRPSQSHHSASAPAVGTLGTIAAGAATGYLLSSGRPSHSGPNHSANTNYESSTNTSSSKPSRPGKASSYSSNGAHHTVEYAGGIAAAAGAQSHGSHLQASHVTHGQGTTASGTNHRHVGPLHAIVNFVKDPDGVAQYEEYTEYIGVCKGCFDRNSTPRDAPRKHRHRSRRSVERKVSSARIDKLSRYSSSDEESRRSKEGSFLGAGLAGFGLAKVGETLFTRKNDFQDTSDVKSGRFSPSQRRNAGRRSSEKVPRRDNDARPQQSEFRIHSHSGASSSLGGHQPLISRSNNPDVYSVTNLDNAGKGLDSVKRKPYSSPQAGSDVLDVSRENDARRSRKKGAHKKGRKKKSKGFFNIFSASSSSSSEDLPGRLTNGKKTRRTVTRDKITNDSEAQAALIGLGTATAALALKDSRTGNSKHRAPRPYEATGSKVYPSTTAHRHHSVPDDPEEVWESASEGEAEHYDAGLAFGSPSRRASLGSDASSSSGTEKWGWRWTRKDRTARRSSRESTTQDSSRSGSVRPAAARKVDTSPPEHSVRHRNAEGGHGPLQYVVPVSTSDPGRFDARNEGSLVSASPLVSTSKDLDIQQPRPVVPVSSQVYESQVSHDSIYGHGQYPKTSHPQLPHDVSDLAPIDQNRTSSQDDRHEEVAESRKLRRRKTSPARLGEDTQRSSKTTLQNESGNAGPSAVRFAMSEEQEESERRERRRRRRESKSERLRRDSEVKPSSRDRNQAVVESDSRRDDDATNATKAAGVIGATAGIAAIVDKMDKTETREERRERRRRERQREDEEDNIAKSERRQKREEGRYTNMTRAAEDSDSTKIEIISGESGTRHSEDSREVATEKSQDKRSVWQEAAAPRRAVHEDYQSFFAPVEVLTRPKAQQIDGDTQGHDDEETSRQPSIVEIAPKIITVAPDEPEWSPADDGIEYVDTSSLVLPWHVPRLKLVHPTPPTSRTSTPFFETTEPLEPAVAKPDVSSEPQNSSDVPTINGDSVDSHFSQSIDHPPQGPDEIQRSPAVDDVTTEVEGHTVSSTASNPQFDDDLEFAATLAASAQDAGFDPSIVIDDPSYRRRDSPPTHEVQEATVSSRRKMDKKRRKNAAADQDLQASPREMQEPSAMNVIKVDVTLGNDVLGTAGTNGEEANVHDHGPDIADDGQSVAAHMMSANKGSNEMQEVPITPPDGFAQSKGSGKRKKKNRRKDSLQGKASGLESIEDASKPYIANEDIVETGTATQDPQPEDRKLSDEIPPADALHSEGFNKPRNEGNDSLGLSDQLSEPFLDGRPEPPRPPDLESNDMGTADPTSESPRTHSRRPSKIGVANHDQVTRASPSPTAVPVHFRRPRPLSGSSRSVSQSPLAQSITETRPKMKPRPRSTEFKASTEMRPLWLVERHQSHHEPEPDQEYPPLPESLSTSAASSILDPEDNRAYVYAEEDAYGVLEDASKHPRALVEPLGSEEPTPTLASFPVNRRDIDPVSTSGERSQSRGALLSEDGVSHERDLAAPPISAMIHDQTHPADLAYPNEEPGSTVSLKGNGPSSINDQKPTADASYKKWSLQEPDKSKRPLPTKPHDLPPPATAESQDLEASLGQSLIPQEPHRISKDMSPDVLLATMVSAAESQDVKIKDVEKEDPRIGLADMFQPAQDQSSVNNQLKSAISFQDTENKPEDPMPASAQTAILNSSPPQDDVLEQPTSKIPVSTSTGLRPDSTESAQLALEKDHHEKTDALSFHPASEFEESSNVRTDQETGNEVESKTASTGDTAITTSARKKGKKGKKDKRLARSLHDPPKALVVDNTDVVTSLNIPSETSDRTAVEDQPMTSKDKTSLSSIAEAYETQDTSKHIDEPQVLLSDPLEDILAKDREEQLVKEGMEGLPDISEGAIQSDFIGSELRRDLESTPLEIDEPDYGESSAKKEEVRKPHDQDKDLPSTDDSHGVMSKLDQDSTLQSVKSGNKILPVQPSSSPQHLEDPPLVSFNLATDPSKEQSEQSETPNMHTTSQTIQPDAYRDFQDEVADAHATSITGGESIGERRIEAEFEASNGESFARTKESSQNEGQRNSEVTLKDDQFSPSNDAASSNPIGLPEVIESSINFRSQASDQVDAPLLEAGLQEPTMGTEIPKYETPSGQGLPDEIVPYLEPDANADRIRRGDMHQDPSDAEQRTMVGISVLSSVKASEESTSSAPHRESSVEKSLEQIKNAETQEEGILSLDNVQSSAPVLVDDPPTREEPSGLASLQASRGRSMSKKEKRKKSKSVAFDLGYEEHSKVEEPLHDSSENFQPDPMSLAASQENQRMGEDETLVEQMSDPAPDIQNKDVTSGASDNRPVEMAVPLPAVETQPINKKEKKKKKKSKGTVFDLGEETINDNDVPMEEPVAATKVTTQEESRYQDGIEKRKSDGTGQELPEERMDESMMVEEEPSGAVDTFSRINTNSKKDKKSKKKSKSIVYDLGEENTGEIAVPTAEPLDVVDTAAQDNINRKKDKKKKKKSKGIDYEFGDEKADEMEPTGEPPQDVEPSPQDGFDLKKNKKKKKAKGVAFDLGTQDPEDVALSINEPPGEAYENEAALLLDEPTGIQASNKKAKKKDKKTKAKTIETATDLSGDVDKSSPQYSAARNLEEQSDDRSAHASETAAEEAATQDEQAHAHVSPFEQPIDLQNEGSTPLENEKRSQKASRAVDAKTDGLESGKNMLTSDNFISNDNDPNDLQISQRSTGTDFATNLDPFTKDLEGPEKQRADEILSSHLEQGSEAETLRMPVADREVVVGKITERNNEKATPPGQAHVTPMTGEADGFPFPAPQQNDSRAHQESFFEANKDTKDQQSLVQSDDGRPEAKGEAVLEDPTLENLGSRRLTQRRLSLDDPIDLKPQQLQQQPSLTGQPSSESTVLSQERLEDASATENMLHKATIEGGEDAIGPSSSLPRHNVNATDDIGFQENTQGEGNGVSHSPGQRERNDSKEESPTSDEYIDKESFKPMSILDKGSNLANPIDTPLSAGSIDLLDAEQQRQYNEEYARELEKHLAADQDNEVDSAEAHEEAAAQSVELLGTLNDDTASRQFQESSENVNIPEPNDNRPQHTIEDNEKDRRGDGAVETLTGELGEPKEGPKVGTKAPTDDVLATPDAEKSPTEAPKMNTNVPHEQSQGVAEAIGDAPLSSSAQHGTDYFDYQPSSRAAVNVGAQDHQLLAADQEEPASDIPAHDETSFEPHEPTPNKELADPETVKQAKGQASQLHGSRKDSKKDRKKKNRKKTVFADDVEIEQSGKQSPKPEASALASVTTAKADISQPQELSADLRNKHTHFVNLSQAESAFHVSKDSDAGRIPHAQSELLPSEGPNDQQEASQPIPTSSMSQSIHPDDLAENVIINKYRQSTDQEHSPPKITVAKLAEGTAKEDPSINDAGNSPDLGYDGELQQEKLLNLQSLPKDPPSEGVSASRRSRRTSATHYDSDDSADSGFDVQKRRRTMEALAEERRPSPVDSTSKDRSSALFESSLFSNEASKFGQMSKGDDQAEAVRETVEIESQPSWSFARVRPEDDTLQPSLFGGSSASDAAVPAISAEQTGSLHAKDVSNDRSKTINKPSMAKDSVQKDKRRASRSDSQSTNSKARRTSDTDNAGFKESPLSMLKALSTHFEQPDIRDSSKREFEAHNESKGSRRASQQSTASAAPSIESVHAYIHTPDRIHSPSGQSFRSTGTPPLRRVDRSVSSDLRAASRKSSGAGVLTPTFEEEGDARKHANRKITGRSGSPSALQDQQQIPYASSSKYNPVTNKGKSRAGEGSEMADYEGWGDVRGQSPISPTRPPSLRKLQSMQFTEMEQRYAILASENSLLQNAKLKAEKRVQEQEDDHSQLRRNYEVALKEHKSYVAERDGTVRELNTIIDALRDEVAHLTEIQVELTQSRELAVQARDSQLSVQHRADVEEQLDALRVEKTHEAESLRRELDNAKEQIRKLQEQILASKSSEDLVERDEDYFDSQCQELFKHLTSWVTRFSKLSDTQRCYLASEMRNEAHRDLFEDSMLDGSEVDDYLQDRHRRRDIFMSVTMSLMFKHIFTRYLFGMDREHRQKLKALDLTLQEVGPPSAVHKWRATTLTLLSRRPAFQSHREAESEGVLEDIWSTLATALPPPSTAQADQCRESLRRIINLAVDLSIDMRLQRAEYSMLPPPEAEFDPQTGDIKNRLYFLSTSMNDRSGIDYSNEELENHGAYLRIVLFPLVVKNTDDEDHIVVCPAQVHVAPIKKGKTVRVMSAADNRSDEASFADGEENGMEGGMF